MSLPVLQSSVPIYLHIPPGKSEPEPTKRISEMESLNLQATLEELNKQTIYSTSAGGFRVALINVISAYGQIPHAMLVPMTRRYWPTLDSLPNDVGEAMMRIAGAKIEWVQNRYQIDQTNIGFNSGPFSIGDPEKGGSQSLLTVFHMHLFHKEPPPECGMKTTHNLFERAWLPHAELSPRQQRLLFSNGHGEILGRLIADRILEKLSSRSAAAAAGLLDNRRWRFDVRGLSAPFDVSVKELISQPRFFQDVLKPVATAAGGLFCDLTEALTDMDCGSLTAKLRQCEEGPLSPADVAFLCRTPAIRPEPEIREAFARHGWPLALLDCLLPAVRARCKGGAEPADMWRKGFSYCAVFQSTESGSAGELRIMPIVYVGAAGVFEATMELLKRIPRPAPLSELRRRSRELEGLAAWLRERVA